ncbi:AraC family transcriptional regulator [Dyella monticola]|uniref:AraC family transcriptional regulator n=1 Tax=Dyella monticola TaxID=1927958 RepID=A0A370X6D3_9GAMM|nr:AraC family transcriptional regulator [Dyella monticola]RDS83928.1 AraC family transcriptional regulator [Dyella monticola]
MKISADELESLFDALPDVVFFVKDTAGRYTHANLTLVRRLGLKQRSDIIGKSVTELFPAAMGGSYAAQDRRVVTGEVIENQLEVHIFANRAPGWCLTCKRPLVSRGKIRGVIGISRDLGLPDGKHPVYDRLKRVLAYMQENYAEAIRVQALAEQAGLSIAQLERHFRRVFQLTPQQVLTKLRIEAAMRLLRTDQTVASISMACGFIDQSAFARQFKATVGMPPRVYRAVSGLTAKMDALPSEG